MWSTCNSASYLINESILLDIPNGICRELRRMNINPSLIKHVIITHLHGDHFFDLPFYLFSRSNEKSTIYCSKESNDTLLKLIDISFPNAREYINIEFNNDDVFTIDNLVIERKIVSHGNEIKSYGYILYDKNNKVGFTGDTGLCKEVENMAKLCDVLICDCTLEKGNGFHMGIDDLNHLSKHYPCSIFASHIKDETREHIKNDNFQSLTDGKKLVLQKNKEDIYDN